jgi:hypothetical protein
MAMNNNIFNFRMSHPNLNMNNISNFNNMNNPFMNAMNGNIFMSNMNPFFPINSVPNMQNDFNNIGGIINQMNRLSMSNNANNFNIQNNPPIKHFHSDEIRQNKYKNDSNEEIEIDFSFVNSQIFKVKAKQNDKLKDVIYTFKITQCPKELKNSLSVCVFRANKVDRGKTIKELGIQNGEKILFMTNTNPEKEKVVFTEKEKEQIRKLRKDYDTKYLLKVNNKDGNEADDEGDEIKQPIPRFSQFVMNNDNSVGIIVNEHKHRLVFCLTNVSWKCDNCKLKYKKEAEKYYCSLCDYSMCKNCHYTKHYFMKKSFPKGVKSSNEFVNIHFLDTDYHQHRLVFCRSSRHFSFYNKWNCDNCRECFDNDQWSFYCTVCDFDLCCDCCGYH